MRLASVPAPAGAVALSVDCGRDAERGGLVGELLDELVLLDQHLLGLRQLLELHVDVAGLRIVPRLQAVDLEPQLGDAILVGAEDRLGLASEEMRDVGRHQEADEGQGVAGEQGRKAGVEHEPAGSRRACRPPWRRVS